MNSSLINSKKPLIYKGFRMIGSTDGFSNYFVKDLEAFTLLRSTSKTY